MIFITLPTAVRIRGYVVLKNAPPSELARRALAQVKPGDVEGFHEAMRAKTEAARALRKGVRL